MQKLHYHLYLQFLQYKYACCGQSYHNARSASVCAPFLKNLLLCPGSHPQFQLLYHLPQILLASHLSEYNFSYGFQTYENILSATPALRAAIGALYYDLIDFCPRALHFFGRTSVRKSQLSTFINRTDLATTGIIFGSFDKDFREVSDNIRHH